MMKLSQTSLKSDDRKVPAPAAPQPPLPDIELAGVTPEQSPEASFEPLDGRIVTAERISNWIFIAGVAVGGLAAQAIYAGFYWPPGVISGAFAASYVLLLIFLVWAGHFYPARAYRHAAWRLSEQGLEIRRGVWWKHEITIPRARVQHTDVHQGPLQRKFGLARLVIHTAGTHDASITLDGLAFETAQRLRTALVADCVTESATREAR